VLCGVLTSTGEAMAEGHASLGRQAGVVEAAFGRGTRPFQTESPAFRSGSIASYGLEIKAFFLSWCGCTVFASAFRLTAARLGETIVM
jgi:hypothetical protein